MLVEFVGQSVQDQSNTAINPARLVNCYREPVMAGGKTRHIIRNVLGQTLLDDIGAAAVRAMGRANGSNWVAGDGKLFELADAGTTTQRATIADDSVTAINGNYADTTITAGGNYYVWDGTTLTQPTGKTFTNVGHHFFVGDYTVLLEQSGKRFQWSALGDASTLDALDFATANKRDDNLVRGFEISGAAVLMSEQHSELWQITGAGGAEAFAFVTSWNRGLKSANLATKVDDNVFFVGDDGNVYIGAGSNLQNITTPAIKSAIESNTPTHCFFHEDRGYKHCYLRFSDRAAWVFNTETAEWHERAEGPDNGAFRAVAAIEGDTWQVGNSNGEIHSLTRNNKDFSAPLRRTMISLPVYTGDRFRTPKIEINVQAGDRAIELNQQFVFQAKPGVAFQAKSGFAFQAKSDNTGVEREGQVHLRLSRDGGRTWTDRKTRGVGLSGDYTKRTVWRAQGHARQLAVQLYIDEPADYHINSTAVFEAV